MKKSMRILLFITMLLSILSANVFASDYSNYGIRSDLNLEDVFKDNSSDPDWIQFNASKDVKLDKVWTIEFSDEVKASKLEGIVIKSDDNLIPVQLTFIDTNKVSLRAIGNLTLETDYVLKARLSNGKLYRKEFTTVASPTTREEDMLVHFIDVGQGSAVLIQSGDSNMIVDAGDNQYGERVVNYLKDNGVSKLDYVIGTHPHADHIGGLDDVINAFEVGKVLLPDVSHTTRTFENLLIAIRDNNLKITRPNVGDTYVLGDAKWTIAGPHSDSYDKLNDYSIVVRLDHGHNSFLLTGDAESTSEYEMLGNHSSISLDVNVLQVPHHGSHSSSTESFLKAVKPQYAVIQVGADNRYGHPHTEVLSRLLALNANIFRNDIHGHIVFTSTKSSLSVNTLPWKADEFDKPAITRVNINTASLEELQEIVHIGPAYANQIIGLRPFKSVNELTRVSGIGDARLRDIIYQRVAYAN